MVDTVSVQRKDDWEKCVQSLQWDIKGMKMLRFKIFKHLQLHNREKLKINPTMKRE
jgi:hypothetical protein